MNVELIPRRVLFGNPERAMATVSPDGARVAYLAPVEGVLNVWVGPADHPEDARPVTDDGDRGIRAYLWAHDDRHLLYLQDRGGDENWRLYCVDLEEGAVRDMTPFDGVQAQPIAASPRVPGEILIGLNRDNPALHDAYRLVLETGQLELVGRNTGFGSPTGSAWIADAELQIRAVIRPATSGGYELCVADGEDWKPIQSFDHEDSLTTAALAVSGDGSALYMLSSRAANTARLVRLDLQSGREDVVAEDPDYDVGDVLLDPDSRVPLMVGFVRDRLEHQVIDPSLAGDLATLSAICPGDLHVEDTDDANRRWVVTFVVDDGPARTYLFDRPTGSATFLFENRPELSRYTLASMEPFVFEARDGLVIHGYLTFPPGSDRSRLPAVLDVHGGPWTRDVWGFNPEAQWLANRGYLCVQVNYRGSTGYGKEFTNAGDREWGARMHDDLIDAVEWIVDQGYADRSRVCIYGGSYGGYAALVGAAFTPDVFRCAVDIVGPSNLKTLLDSVPPYWLPLIEQFNRRVGNRDSEAEFLWSRSPLSRVDDIRIPLLIAQGANDPRVKQAERSRSSPPCRTKASTTRTCCSPTKGTASRSRRTE